MLADDDDKIKPKLAKVARAQAINQTLLSLLSDESDDPVAKPPAKPVPADFFRITTRTVNSHPDRVIVLAKMDPIGHDLLCFHPRLGITIHLRRADLSPTTAVAEAIEFVAALR